MRDENAVFGGEVSGHFYFRDNWYADNGMIPALLVLELLGREGRKLSELLAPLRARYFISGEINSKVADVAARARPHRGALRATPDHRMDGVSVDYADWHFNVRPSNTEPLLRLNLEAYTAADMERRRDEVWPIRSRRAALPSRLARRTSACARNARRRDAACRVDSIASCSRERARGAIRCSDQP